MNQVEYQTRKLTASFIKLREGLDLNAGLPSEEFKSAGKAVCMALDKLENELLR